MEKEEFLKKVGARIKEIRQQKGINQSELARKLDKERSSIERIENGKINTSIYMLKLIADALEIEAEDLMKLV